jgi:hypothetical protein
MVECEGDDCDEDDDGEDFVGVGEIETDDRLSLAGDDVEDDTCDLTDWKNL